MMQPGPASFSSDDRDTVADSHGQLAHRKHVEHSLRLQRAFTPVGDSAWCLVGNGLSNQSFVRGPGGIIAIDTGESVEEMHSALLELRKITAEPIVAVLYTHFHYVQGTRAIVDERKAMGITAELPIFGHERIADNLTRSATAIAPTYSRGIVEQFAVALPTEGIDGVVNVGLGLAYRNAEHAPFTAGHLPVTSSFDSPTRLHIAGLDVDVVPAPSDADDSVTYWFPHLRLAAHNLVWPTLFNVFAIRGEEYRDPQVLLQGIDHLVGLQPVHLLGTHGPPLSGAEVLQRVMKYRDSIQFLWDQTVRHTNAGASSIDLAHLVRLPDAFDDDYLTSQLYGVVEHHTRQIRSGLFGWFDGDPANLFPLARGERATQFIEAMGGVAAVRAACESAQQTNPRWSLELAGLLVAHPDSNEADQRLLAEVLRVIARRTTAANIRNWCLARAREADGQLDLSRFRQQRWSRRQVSAWGLAHTLEVLRVTLVPERAEHLDVHLRLIVGQDTAGLHIRNCVAVSTNGTAANEVVTMDIDTWVEVLGGVLPFSHALTAGRIEVAGSGSRVATAFGVFDHPSLANSSRRL